MNLHLKARLAAAMAHATPSLLKTAGISQKNVARNTACFVRSRTISLSTNTISTSNWSWTTRRPGSRHLPEPRVRGRKAESLRAQILGVAKLQLRTENWQLTTGFRCLGCANFGT